MSINVKNVKRVLLTSNTQSKEPLKEFDAGDKMPAFRQNGYQLDFTNATNAKITYNSVDYPQTTLITSFVAEGKIWLFEESKGNSIESETGEIAVISINEDNNFLNATVWNKKPFALDFDSANSEYLSLNNTKSLVNDGDYIHIKGIITQPLPLTNNPYLFRNESPLNFLRLLNNGDIRLEYNNGSASVWSNMYSSNEIDLKLEIASSGSIWRITTPQSVSSKTRVASVPFTIDSFFKGGGVFTGFELYSLEINGEQFNLTEGLGNEVLGSDGTIATINTSHASGTERINYGVWQKGNDTDGWTPYI